MASPDGSRSPELGKPISERDRKAEKAAKAERKAERQRHKLAKAERKAAAAGPAPEGTRDGEQERVEPDKEREKREKEREREESRDREPPRHKEPAPEDAHDASRSRRAPDQKDERDPSRGRRGEDRSKSIERSRPDDRSRSRAERPSEKRPREPEDERESKRRREAGGARERSPERGGDRRGAGREAAQGGSRDRDRDRQRERDDRDRQRRRERSDERGDKREAPGGRSRDLERQSDRPSDRPSDRQVDRKREEADAAAMVAQRDDAAREVEQAELEDEAEKRRKRIEAWQALKRKQTEEDDEAGAAKKAKGWSFEDESEDDDEAAAQLPAPAEPVAAQGPPPQRAPADGDAPEEDGPGGAGDMEEGGDEIDPLDAFMAANDSQAAAAFSASDAAAAAVLAAAEEGEEVDPLDAFMASQAIPTAPQVSTGRGPSPAAAAAQPPVTRVKLEPGLASAASAAAPAAAQLPAPAAAVAGVKAEPVAGANGDAVKGGAGKPPAKRKPKRYYDSDESSDDEADTASEDDEEWARNVRAGKTSKGDKLGPVDHAAMNYRPFRRNFYIEVPELTRMSAEELVEYRKQLDGIKVRGKDIPKPVKNWNQCGLSSRVLDVLKKAGLTAPMPIQAQALPVVMSGRDCIGVAKTGSGKTLAFVLPMLRHIKDQPVLAQGDGPIALVMAPTRELVQQIGKDVKRFGKALGINCVCVFGGSGIANQISELKRGTEVVCCTPGRMIDILVTSGGKITNMRRVTYLVLDEADRMFDMGFEPQIKRITQNIRPDRQNVLFSATFPRSVEVLARQMLANPVEIQVGGRSVVNADITQQVELRAEDDRFLRLLEILGLWYEKGKLLIFVGSQEKCDDLFRNLLRSGYPCLSLHGGKDQSDRESTISDFKSDVCNVLIATSIAARGLDVKDLVLVVNHDPPNHHEDYVHRVGRTGRAGNKGTAITFIGPDEERYAPDLVKALRESGAPVPADLLAMAEAFREKRERGEVHGHGSGFGGSGFKFDAAEADHRKAERKAAVRAAGFIEPASESDDEAPAKETRQAPVLKQEPQAVIPDNLPAEARAALLNAQAMANRLSAAAEARSAGTITNLSGGIRYVQPGPPLLSTGPTPPGGMPAVSPAHMPGPVPAFILAAQAAADSLSGRIGAAMGSGGMGSAGGPQSAAQLAARFMQQAGVPGGAAAPVSVGGGTGVQLDTASPHYEADLEINDFPQHARWKVTHRETVRDLAELTGAAITTRGVFLAPNQKLQPGERKLYLLIQGPTEQAVKAGKAEVKRILEETTEKVMRRDQGAAGTQGRYTIM